MSSRTVPPDFDAFWRGLAERARSVAPRAEARAWGRAGLLEVRCTSVGGMRLGGWLRMPAGEPTAAVVVGHGYGGRFDVDPGWAPEDAVAFYPVARGLPALSLTQDIPPDPGQHVLHGIGSRETYILGDCCADLVWCALTALEELLGRPLGQGRGGLRTIYVGQSFGGGIGALAAPWDDRLDALALHVPTFGDNAARLAVPCVGSGAAVAAWVVDHPEAWEVLDYFDAATAAALLQIPTLVSPALHDPAVPPVGQWGVANAMPAEFREVLPLTAGHIEYPAGTEELTALQTRVRQLAGGDPAPSTCCCGPLA